MQFQTLGQKIKRKIKDIYQAYLENLMGLNDDENSWKNFRHTTSKSWLENKLYSDTKIKANCFNQQFNSVFTRKEPLSLSRMANLRVQDLKTVGGLPSDTIPDLQQDTAIKMPEIDV